MALYWSKFQSSENNFSREEESLYRIRDYDDPNINKAKLVNRNFLAPHRDAAHKYDKIKLMTFIPKDPIWESMTENERIENGLPTKALFRMSSFYHLLLFGTALGLSIARYSSLFYPYGVVLRAKRPETWSRFLSVRAPLCVCTLYAFYVLNIYVTKYTIDFSSPHEDALEEEFKKITK